MEKLSFGERLRMMRKMKKMKQEDFAEKLSVTRSCIANYENDKRMPKYDLLCSMAKLFEVPTDFLIAGTKIPEELKDEFSNLNYFKKNIDIDDMHPDDKMELFLYKEELVQKRNSIKSKPNRKYSQA